MSFFQELGCHWYAVLSSQPSVWQTISGCSSCDPEDHWKQQITACRLTVSECPMKSLQFLAGPKQVADPMHG